jgi:outer membrane protein assembly factor BamD
VFQEGLRVIRRDKLSVVPLLLLAGVVLTAGVFDHGRGQDRVLESEPHLCGGARRTQCRVVRQGRATVRKLEGRAAGTPLAQQAQLEKAYAHHKAGEQAQAIATLDRFIKLHPASPALDYALYMKGVVNFNDNLGMFSFISRQDLSERDQKAAKESFEAFKDWWRAFPTRAMRRTPGRA